MRNTLSRMLSAVLTRTSVFPDRGESGASEVPRQVFVQACQGVASELASEGFQYFKSGPHCVRETEAFSYRIAFQSSHRNVAGRHVRLWLSATVRCKALEEWRLRQPNSYGIGDSVSGGMLHVLIGQQKVIEWDLANQHDRNTVMADVVSRVRKDICGYFQQFATPDLALATAAKQHIHAFPLISAVELALCLNDRPQAIAILERFLREHGSLRKEIEELTKSFRIDGLPKSRLGSYAEQVAWARVAYNLKSESTL